MLSAKIADQSSDSIFVSFYRDQGQQLMGSVTAADIKRMKEENQVQEVSDAFFNAQFRYHTIILKARIVNNTGNPYGIQGQ